MKRILFVFFLGILFWDPEAKRLLWTNSGHGRLQRAGW